MMTLKSRYAAQSSPVRHYLLNIMPVCPRCASIKPKFSVGPAMTFTMILFRRCWENQLLFTYAKNLHVTLDHVLFPLQ